MDSHANKCDFRHVLWHPVRGREDEEMDYIVSDIIPHVNIPHPAYQGNVNIPHPAH